MSREATAKLLQLVDDGLLTPYQVMLACINYMSEADVEDMATSEGFIEEDEESDDDEDTDPEDEDCDFDGDDAPAIYESEVNPGYFGFVGCDSDIYPTFEAALEAASNHS